MQKSIKEQIMYIKAIKARYHLSVDKICDLVSGAGGFASPSSVRRLTAKGAEDKGFRPETIECVYDALLHTYGTDDGHAPEYIYSHFKREDYEGLIGILKDNAAKLREKAEEQEKVIEKQQKMIDILWHGLQTFGQSTEEYKAILDYYEGRKKP